MELDRLSLLIGAFEGEIRIVRLDAPVLTGRMRYSAQWDLDSAWVTARYEQTVMGRTTRGVLMYSWDARARQYLFYGFPNTPMEPNRLRGAFHGSVLVFESDSTASLRYRETWELNGRDTLVTELAGMRDGAWVTGPRTVLVRVAR